MDKRVIYSRFVRAGICPLLKEYGLPGSLCLFGADTETVRGKPWTIQVHGDRDTLFAYVNADDILPRFLDWLEPRCSEAGPNLVYFHNLKFDSTILFHNRRREIFNQGSEVSFIQDGALVKMLFGKVNIVKIRRGSLKVELLDSRAFTQSSLARSLKMFAIKETKLEKPEGLGSRRLKTPEFEAYAIADAVSLYHLSKAILRYHAEYGIRPSISLPQFASRVFRCHFLRRGEVIKFPPPSIIRPAELSYHGGKNGYYLDSPQVIEDAFELDINSAFPYAMAQLPQFIKGSYVETRDFDPGAPGIYCVSGRDDGHYPIVFDHAFRPARGRFRGVWITGHELSRALASPEVKIDKLRGYCWIADSAYEHNPLADYVDHFYSQKERTLKKDPNYNFFKIMLNALYGKFVQTAEVRRAVVSAGKSPSDYSGEIDGVYDPVSGELKSYVKSWRAGGLYNPFIATQITGYVRGMLYDLEVKYEAFHSATDAIKTQQPVIPVKGLGGLKIETFGRCYAFRNKLYLHCAKGYGICGHDPGDPPFKDAAGRPLLDSDGQHLCKVGLHGFKADIPELWANRFRLLREKSLTYNYNHMVGLREGFKRREEISDFISRRETLTLK